MAARDERPEHRDSAAGAGESRTPGSTQPATPNGNAAPIEAGVEASAEAAANGAPDEDEDEPIDTPFEHPLFVPVVLLGLSLWFLWDGFIVPMEDHLSFNRWGFGVLAVLTLWFGYRGIREMREEGRDERDE